MVVVSCPYSLENKKRLIIMKFKDITAGDMVVVGNGNVLPASILKVTKTTASQFSCGEKRFNKFKGTRIGAALSGSEYSASPATPELIKKTRRDHAYRKAKKQCSAAIHELNERVMSACTRRHASHESVKEAYKIMCEAGLVNADDVVDLGEF